MKRFTLALSAAAFAAAVMAGCGGSEPATPTPTPTPAAAPAPAAAPDAAAAPAPAPAAAPAPQAAATAHSAAAGAPATVSALQLIPAQAQVGLALPALNGVIGTLLNLDQRVASIDLKAELDKVLIDLKQDAGTPEAQSLGDVAAAKGLSLDKPAAVFADFTPTLNDIKKRVDEAKAKAAAAPAAAASEAQAPAPTPEIDMDGLATPLWAVAVGVGDAAKATAFLEELAAQNPSLGEKGTAEAAGIEIQTRGDYGYFFAGENVVVGSTAMLEGVAERVKKPAALRYGTPEMPATGPQEAVAVLYGERVMPMVKDILPNIPIDDAMKPAIMTQIASMEKAFSGSQGEDPGVITLALDETAVKLSMRMDTAMHPGILEQTGTPKPLQLAQKLPTDTLVMIALAITPEFKKQIGDVVLPAAMQSMDQIAAAQGASMAKQALDMIGSEITLGIAPVSNDFPAAFLMVNLSNPEPTKSLLQMLVPTMPDASLADYGIASIAAPIPVPLSMAFVEDVMLVSNNTDGMKKIIDLTRAKGATDFMASLNPPLDPATPRYQTIVLDSRLVTDVLMPLSSLAGGIPPEAQPAADLLSMLIREVRIVNELQGTVNNSSITLAIKDAA